MPDTALVRRPSLVDGAEEALRDWLTPGRHKTGDRLPPEHDLAAMLGVSRGTLRTALQRLEQTGEIVRRQGSGTFVGRVAARTALDEGLEKLESYTSLARRRGIRLSVRDLRIEDRPIGADVGHSFALAPTARATTFSRVLVADGEAAAVMLDVVRPGIPLPTEARLRRALEHGDMMLDVLLAQDVSIAYSSTSVMSRLITPRSAEGRALGVTRTTAALELEEVVHLTSGEAVQHSRDLFAPGGLDLHVIRWLDVAAPARLSGRRRPGESVATHDAAIARLGVRA